MTIRHVIAAAACALGLAACSSSNADLWVPSWTAFGVKPTTVSVTIEFGTSGRGSPHHTGTYLPDAVHAVGAALGRI